MKTIEEIRRENLQILIDGYASGNATKFGDIVGRSQSQISNVLNHVRDIGSALARDIEIKLNLERGWLDHDHDEKAPLYTTNDPLVARAMQIMEPMPTYAKELEIRSLLKKRNSSNSPAPAPNNVIPIMARNKNNTVTDDNKGGS
ncbi:MAG: hypothetical protein Q8M07_01050 [Prosthecobacter sp.]|nr:hypothetical protein [Prosthecobacter sp.]